MKKFALSFTFLSILFLFSCNNESIRPSGISVIVDEDLDPFTSISVSHAFQVELLPAEGQSQAVVTIDENLAPFLVLEVEDGRMQLGISENINIRGATTLKATIYHESVISRISQSGASFIESFDVLESTDLSIDLSGASSFRAGLKVDNFYADVSGASNLDLRGSVADAEIDLSGASTLSDYAFGINRLGIDLSGASTCEITVTDELSVEASGASRMYYQGDPVINSINISGASTVKSID